MTSLKFYLSARFCRREELCQYKVKLEHLGHQVTSAWLLGVHERDDNNPDAHRAWRQYAQRDIDDINESDIIMCFTEESGRQKGRGRGGRHVELGIALGTGKRVVVIGPKENVFCCLPQVLQYDTFQAFCGALMGVERRL